MIIAGGNFETSIGAEITALGQLEFVHVRENFGAAVEVAPPGHAIGVVWQNVLGASKVEIQSARARIAPAIVEKSLGELHVQNSGNHRLVTIPSGKRIRSLTLNGLKGENPDAEDPFVALNNESDLRNNGFRLLVSIPDGQGGFLPAHTVPSVSARGVLPASLTGAGYHNKVLTLPDVAANRIRLSVVKRNFPEDFEPVNMQLDSVIGRAAILPRDLQLVDPAGAAAWSFPGELPPQTPATEIDLRFALEANLNAALKSKQALEVTFHLRAAEAAKVEFRFDGARGALLRDFPGVTRTVLEGEPVVLASAAALAEERPSSVTADLTVRYEGVRILETVSDAFPSSLGNVHGIIAGERAVTRALPPAALIDLPVVRIGLIGRAPVACELSVQLVEMTGEVAGKAVGAPGVITLQPQSEISTAWIKIPEIDPPNFPLGVSVRANFGRFFWVSTDKPLVRMAVRDPDPGNRQLFLNGNPVVVMNKTEIHLPGHAFTPQAFQSTLPVLASDLFLTVDFSDLVLRYGR